MFSRLRLLFFAGMFLSLVICICASCGGKTAETGDTGPLLSMLAGVPQDPIRESESFVTFVDYAAAESAYGITRPADYAEFKATDAWDEATEAWWYVFKHLQGPSYSAYWLKMVEMGPGTVGFSPFQVDRVMEYGAPPSTGVVLSGDFDAAAIGVAYEANFDLAAKDFDGTTMWLWGDDPESGLKVDPANRAPENPFGGQLGRRQPMIISDERLMSSADLSVVLAYADAAAGKAPSLADDPDYRAAVDAVSEGVEVVQAIVAGPTITQQMGEAPLVVLDPTAMTPIEMEEMIRTVAETMLKDFKEVSPYSLLIAADTVGDDEQMARLALVFPDAGSAETAGTALLGRLSRYLFLASDRSISDILAELKVTTPRYHVSESSGRAVLVLEFPAPKPTTAEIASMQKGDGLTGTGPGATYGLFLQMLMQRDIGWLSTVSRSELEELR